MNKKQLWIFVFVLFFAACKKDTPPDTGVDPLNSATLLIGNEGAWGQNTASLSQINIETGEVSNGIYKKINGELLGDVLQDVKKAGSSYYMVLNGSNKVIVTDSGFQKTGEIDGLSSPRYFLKISDSKAYVSSLYGGYVHILDLMANTVSGQIATPAPWSEGMVFMNSKVYVCNADTAISYISVINPQTDKAEDSISLGSVAAHHLVSDKDSRLWILSGNQWAGFVSKLTCLDPVSKKILKSFTFPANQSADKIAVNGWGDELYVLTSDYTGSGNGIYKIKTDASSLPPSFLIQAEPGRMFYGLSVDPDGQNNIFVTDANGFTQAGFVHRYSSLGVLKNSYTCGIGPSILYFLR